MGFVMMVAPVRRQKNQPINSFLDGKRSHLPVNLEELFEPYSPPETNFLERLRYWSVAVPDKIAFRFLEGGEEETDSLTYCAAGSKRRARSRRNWFPRDTPVTARCSCILLASNLLPRFLAVIMRV